ncbi:hypothetical protein TNIN_274771 [Trichonephila inaurata madagascariensis]|uniref:Secreted protein n=1 Tax=Trichonephila inaurata madagascariensis TaxID=2747483 RepID=A0A8X6X827_9ARAC|nr:hypothetical protein TNIN_274771 [Trichonephila inaurata madagascariensis]
MTRLFIRAPLLVFVYSYLLAYPSRFDPTCCIRRSFKKIMLPSLLQDKISSSCLPEYLQKTTIHQVRKNRLEEENEPLPFGGSVVKRTSAQWADATNVQHWRPNSSLPSSCSIYRISWMLLERPGLISVN